MWLCLTRHLQVNKELRQFRAEAKASRKEDKANADRRDKRMENMFEQMSKQIPSQSNQSQPDADPGAGGSNVNKVRVGPQHGRDDSLKTKVAATVQAHVSHIEAIVFKFLEANPEMEVRYANEKAQEKVLVEVEDVYGGITAAITSAMEVTETVLECLDRASSMFLGGSKMANTRQLASDTCLNVKVCDYQHY